MITAIWIIAIVEIVRMTCAVMQIRLLTRDTGARESAYEEFIKSLKVSDREYVRNLLEQFEQIEIMEEKRKE